MDFKYEIGDEFRSACGAARKVIGRHGGGGPWYWVADENDEPATYIEASLDSWTKIEPFFRVGDTFTSPYSSSTTMTITHVDDELKAAWATATYSTGKQVKESYTQMTWVSVKDEVLRNRKG